jgi:hypothetical protein
VGVGLLAISFATGLVESAASFTDNWLRNGGQGLVYVLGGP